jgi:hypothetical protein
LAQIAGLVIAISRDVLVGRTFGFDDGWRGRQDSPDEHGAISKCPHGPQSQHSYDSDHYGEMMPPARARETTIVIIGTVSFAGLGRLDIIIVTVIGRGEQQSRCLETGQKPIVDLGRAKPVRHKKWLGRRGNGVVLPPLALVSCSLSRGRQYRLGWNWQWRVARRACRPKCAV